MNNETDKLSTRIAELEKELAAMFAKKIRHEEALATDYTKGSDPQKNIKIITDCDYSTKAIIGALKQLDIKLYDTQVKEHTELALALDKDTKEKYEQALKAALRGLKVIEKNLVSIMPPDSLPELSNKLLDTCKISIWNVLDSVASDRYSTEVPNMPVAIQSRNSAGEKTDTPLDRMPFGGPDDIFPGGKK